MPSENSVNQDEIVSQRKINLVATDPDGNVAHKTAIDSGGPSHCLPSPPSPTLQHTSPPASSVDQTAGTHQASLDPQRVMHDLPADEFFKALERATPEQLQSILHSFEKGSRTSGGAKWLQKLMDVPKGRRSVISTLLWWECRRPLYNLAVGLAGLPSLLILSVFGMGHSVFFAALFYAFFANVCYCLGAPVRNMKTMLSKQ